ncbi:hypothetical protein ACFVUS_28260 [Nocardia sp. NPDC058058]|uniref:hypothetical protein n=1 Tax=Nocardia sp. NPDC058058 TaxID=3346317 RepID=UPI0036DB11D2
MIENLQAPYNSSTAPQQRWEYQVGSLIRPSDKHILGHLDEMSQDGWELVTSTVDGWWRRHYFYWRKPVNA